MAKKPLPTPDELRQLLRYDPETGNIFWRERPGLAGTARSWNTRHAGNEAGSPHVHGYLAVRLTISGKPMLLYAHRIAWTIATGAWPEKHIDHINGNPADNRLSNLREATRSENMRNRSARKGGSSRFCGVSLHRGSGLWRVELRTPNPSGKGRGKTVHVGYFKDEVAAARAYNEAAIRHHGEFARLNSV